MTNKPIKRIAVTGGAGQIAYSLLFRIAAGDMLGPDQPIHLSILDIPGAEEALKGVKMELDDCAFSLLKGITVTTSPEKAFEEVDIALLVGAKPRGPGMERGDLLKDNGKIFIEQGKALGKGAKENCVVLVVGNPCNTNCLIASKFAAPRLKPQNFHAMTRLDHNRALTQLAQKAGTTVPEVMGLTIWGNHSATQVPDFTQVKIQESAIEETISDRKWLETTFFETVQKRGAAIIEARGKSSAASAASAAIDAIKSLFTPTSNGKWFSSAVYTAGNPYGIDENLFFSFPCKSAGDGTYHIVKDLAWDEFISKKIKASEEELIQERSSVEELLKAKVGD